MSSIKAANLAFRQKKYKEAISLYQAAIAEEPGLNNFIQINIELANRRLGIGVKPVASVDVVVPVYNALEDVKKCLASLQRNTDGFNVRIIVVNDGSEKDTSEWLREFCKGKPLFQLIEHAKNSGYTKAVNTGLKASSADYAVTQNSDTIVSKGWLTGLIRCMESSPSIGIVGPLSNAASWQNVPHLHDETGAFAVNEIPNGYSVDEMADLVRSASQRVYPRLPFANGFCFMIKKAVLEKIGFMDEENFPIGYGEENDFCIRAIDAGFEIAIADDTYVFHAKSKSFGHESRKILSQKGTDSLKKKHTAEKYFSRVESIKKNKDLDTVREKILFKLIGDKSENFNDFLGKSVDVVDMHGSKVSLQPAPVFGDKNYQVEPVIDAPCVIIPFEKNKIHTNNLLSKNKFNGVGVHLHLHYFELLDEFIFYLKNIPLKFKLYVSINDDLNKRKIKDKLKKEIVNADVFVEYFPNKGRDIAPFLVGFGEKMAENEIICHIHSKRSLHNLNKSDWRRQLLVNLMGSQALVEGIFDIFSDNKKVGLVFPEYHHSLNGQISWGTNFDISKKLAEEIGLKITKERIYLFPAGSMFWARTDALRGLFKRSLGWEDFPDESGQVDGTVAHAVERILGEICVNSGFKTVQVKSEKPYNLMFYHPHKWPYKFSKTESQINFHVDEYINSKKSNNRKIAVYTAMTGGYDQPVVHECLSDSVDYFFFTDKPVLDKGFWKVRPVLNSKTSSVKVARFIKSNPHKYLSNYDYAVWIDANVIIRCDIEKYVRMAVDDPGTPIFGISHPQRQCIYEEAKAVIASKKDSEDRVFPQIERYKAEGYPSKNGLIESNFLIINLKNPRSIDLMKMWSDEIENGSHRDQLSLNYCLWKTKSIWKPIFQEKITLRDSFDFAYLGHGRNSGYPEVKIFNEKVVNPYE